MDSQAFVNIHDSRFFATFSPGGSSHPTSEHHSTVSSGARACVSVGRQGLATPLFKCHFCNPKRGPSLPRARNVLPLA